MPELLAAINAARAQPRYCVNGGSLLPAVAALNWNSSLANAAERHSADMAKNNFFSHTGSDGSNFSGRISAAGYQSSTAGENIALGYPSVAAVVDGWLRSPGHCVNIMNVNFQEFGGSCKFYANSGNRPYWTTDFGRPR